MPKTFQDFVADAKSRIREVTANEVKQRLAVGDGATILDVREESDFAKGHILGATHLSRGVLELKAPKMLPNPNQEIICYCGGGSRSALAADVLQQMGYTNVVSMTGGFSAWTDANGAVET